MSSRSSRAVRMARAMAYGTSACDHEDALLGTFIPDNRTEPHSFGSMAFLPDIAEEEERVTHNDPLRTRNFSKSTLGWRLNEPFVPDEEISTEETETIPLFPKLAESLESALFKVLAADPRYVILVYARARDLGRDDILALLPGIVAELVRTGIYSAQDFQQTRGAGQSHYKMLKGYAKLCPVANGMFQALSAATA